jgi:hypothetical protein
LWRRLVLWLGWRCKSGGKTAALHKRITENQRTRIEDVEDIIADLDQALLYV